MNLSAILRKGVKIIDNVTKSAQVEITMAPWIGETSKGTPSYGTSKKYRVILDLQQREMMNRSGQLNLVIAYIAFLYPVAPNGAAERVEPIDARDRITLPDGTTAPIIDIEGFLDRDTEQPYFHQVWLGSRQQAGAQ